MDKLQLQRIFSKPYDEEDWINVLRNVFGVRQMLQQPRKIMLSNSEKAKAAYELGNLTTADDRLIGIYRVDVNPDVWLERNKVGLRDLLRSVYRYDVDGAIIVFVQDEKWRLSFVSEIKVLNDDGDVIDQVTEPKRYTYLLGRDEKVLTPSIRLSVLFGKPLALKDILEAFSVEALNEEFYKIVAAQFYKLIGGTLGAGKSAKQYERSLVLPSIDQGNRKLFQEFAVRLIGRTVFCWFLKVKKTDKGESLLPEKLLSSEAVRSNPNYYHSILERLFFQTLNTPMDQRLSGLPEGCEQIPFLNGGLFEPHDHDFFRPDQATGLSRNINTLKIGDDWFLEFFSELEKYNFTIDENSVTDVEVSVDPEMLGRIFENLLAEIDPDSGETARKATGSFYTPREVVDYMATESLVQYLHNRTQIRAEDLRLIFKMTDRKPPEFSSSEREAILDGLDQVKVLDPACGSGAFPMGVLQKIVMALQKLDPDAAWWKKRQIDRNGNAIVRSVVKQKLDASTSEYARKIGIIQNSLYGVDIQPIAAEISKLRCFLTLIVDENIDDSKSNRGIEPLPNLEFKFVTADTLLKLPVDNGQQQLFSHQEQLETLQELRLDYLQSYGADKEVIKRRFLQTQHDIYQLELTFFEDTKSKGYLLSTWNPFGHEKVDWFDPKWMFGVDSFDLVIGNPPYVQMQKDQGALAKRYADCKYQTYERTGDVYALFYERSFDLLREKGTLCFITSNQWMLAKYGASLRSFFLSKNPLNLVNLGPGVFQSATVDTNVLIAENQPYQEQLFAIDLSDRDQLLYLTEADMQPMIGLDADRWTVKSAEESIILGRINKLGKRLKNWGVQINFGVKTGYNEAFIVDEETRHALIQEEVKNKNIIKPVLKGREIQRYIAKSDDYIVFVPWHFPLDQDLTIKGASEKAESFFKKEFPSLYRYLLKYKDGLSKRNKAETGIRYEWYALQRCAATYKEKFSEEKIVWKRIGSSIRFSYSDEEMYCLDSTCIATGEKIKYLLAYLNSKLGQYQLLRSAPKTGMGDLILSVQALDPLPVYYPTPEQEELFVRLVDIVLFLKDPESHQLNDLVPNSHLSYLFEELIDGCVFEIYFEDHMKDLGIAITDDVRAIIPDISLLPDSEKNRVVKELHDSLNSSKHPIRNKVKLFSTRSPEYLGTIINAVS